MVAAVNTMGGGDTPQLLIQQAKRVRLRMCRELGVPASPEQELQGHLIARMAEKMDDPDTPLQTWLKRGTVPLGIRNPIEPGGLFPIVEPSQSDVDTDLHYWLDNYASYNEHRDGAEEILAKELSKGWLEWSTTRTPLD